MTSTTPRTTPRRPASRLVLALRVMAAFAHVHVTLRRSPLPEAVLRLVTPRRSPPPDRVETAARLGHAVDRTLRVGPFRPRCLHSALVLLRLLRVQGQPAVLVVGLPRQAASNRAHAWVELAGRDVGPPPGRCGHQVLARYPLDRCETEPLDA